MLTFVGVGPGDPELLTLKAARVLREADAIAVADSGGESAVLRIVGEHICGKPVCRLSIPMRGGPKEWERAHRAAADALLQWLEIYPKMAYPVLGDPGIYASSGYLLRAVMHMHPCAVVPGITAMCAMAADLGVPLCGKGEPLTVLDNFEGGPLPEGNVVVMKSGKRLADLRKAVGEREAWAARNLGMPGAWLGSLSEIPEEYSYFTTVIVKGEKEKCGLSE